MVVAVFVPPLALVPPVEVAPPNVDAPPFALADVVLLEPPAFAVPPRAVMPPTATVLALPPTPPVETTPPVTVAPAVPERPPTTFVPPTFTAPPETKLPPADESGPLPEPLQATVAVKAISTTKPESTFSIMLSRCGCGGALKVTHMYSFNQFLTSRKSHKGPRIGAKLGYLGPATKGFGRCLPEISDGAGLQRLSTGLNTSTAWRKPICSQSAPDKIRPDRHHHLDDLEG